VALTDLAVRNTKPAEKQQKLFDAGGLFLLVTPAGGKRWVLKYRMSGKEKSLALGTYPEVSLVEARTAKVTAASRVISGFGKNSRPGIPARVWLPRWQPCQSRAR
jgi:hypothetical protein